MLCDMQYLRKHGPRVSCRKNALVMVKPEVGLWLCAGFFTVSSFCLLLFCFGTLGLHYFTITMKYYNTTVTAAKLKRVVAFWVVSPLSDGSWLAYP